MSNKFAFNFSLFLCPFQKKKKKKRNLRTQIENEMWQETKKRKIKIAFQFTHCGVIKLKIMKY